MTKQALSKTQIVHRMLKRKRGAKLDEIIETTGWQPHSVRAFVSGLRKRGCAVEHKRDKDNSSRYFLTEEPVA